MYTVFPLGFRTIELLFNFTTMSSTGNRTVLDSRNLFRLRVKAARCTSTLAIFCSILIACGAITEINILRIRISFTLHQNVK